MLTAAVVKSSAPTLTLVIPSQNIDRVLAVTSLNDDVFLMRKASQQVEVYDAVTLTFQRHIAVPGLGSSSYGLTACPNNNCLYLSDWDYSSVHRVELSGSNAVKKWSVASNPRGLSVNKVHKLVVACCGANKLQEYSTDGRLVREIRLQAGLTCPWHAIQLSTVDYVVSQWKSSGVVAIVKLQKPPNMIICIDAEDGKFVQSYGNKVDVKVVHSYGQSLKSDVGQMRYPSSLAMTDNGDILVADTSNDRILLIKRSTGCVQELAGFVG